LSKKYLLEDDNTRKIKETDILQTNSNDSLHFAITLSAPGKYLLMIIEPGATMFRQEKPQSMTSEKCLKN